MKNIIVFISGSGTNLKAILEACRNEVLPFNVVSVVSNLPNAGGIEFANEYNIHVEVLEFNSKEKSRNQYDIELANYVNSLNYDLIVLAGWMRILSKEFLSRVHSVINLHPALPGQFSGTHAIERTFEAYQQDLINHGGCMVHEVIEKVDAGNVLASTVVPIYKTDNLDTYRNRVRYYEKPLLLLGITRFFDKETDNIRRPDYHGKVREVYNLGYDVLLMYHTNRQSAFDRQICNIGRKGQILTDLSVWWFNQTEHIIPNHLICSMGNCMFVKKCTAFKIEVVVRGYITGSTKTSLWTHYKKGSRTYSGINFPDGLVKNQKLERNVLTPTTKGEVDIPISAEEIVAQNYMTQEEWDYVSEKALLLFEYGQKLALEKGFLLVDTKYEFGKDSNGNILLIDEIHTCDSSRYWIASSYEERFLNQQEPQKLDKDIIRDYVRQRCDPYNEPLPPIPKELLDKVFTAYHNFYIQLTHQSLNEDQNNLEEKIKLYFNNHHQNIAVIVAGSTSDKAHIDKIQKALNNVNVYSIVHIGSAHKQTMRVMNLLNTYNNMSNRKIIFVTIAGRSNALSGVIAGNTTYPVIACPPFKDKSDMMVNLHSTLQCPSKLPVMTVLDPGNVSLAVRNILNL